MNSAAHLDPASTRQVAEALETVLADRTVVLVSHGPGLAPVASRVIRLDAGALVSTARPASRAGSADTTGVPAAAVIP